MSQITLEEARKLVENRRFKIYVSKDGSWSVRGPKGGRILEYWHSTGFWIFKDGTSGTDPDFAKALEMADTRYRLYKLQHYGFQSDE